MAALIAGNFEGTARKAAYAVIGGVAGAGIAVGPIVGGWATTELSWRVVFAGEVVLVAFILATTRFIADAPRSGAKPRLDGVGTALSASGLGLFVFGVLQSSTWGWVKPKDSPVELFGLSATMFVIALGGALLWSFVRWEQHREADGQGPARAPRPHEDPVAASGPYGLFSQNLILMGVFFVIPLYLQLVLGLDALETGIKMLPVSIAMFISSALGSRLSTRFSIRTIVRAGLWTTFGAALVLVATIDPQLKETGFAVSMGLLGVGMGLMASQLGNVVQSSVDASGRGEAGGLQYTGQQLGSSLGVALIGAIVLTGLTGAFVSNIQADARINDKVATQVSTAAGTGVDFVASTEIETAAARRRTERVGTRTRSSTTTRRHNSSRSRPACSQRRCSRSDRSRSPRTSLTSSKSATTESPNPPQRDPWLRAGTHGTPRPTSEIARRTIRPRGYPQMRAPLSRDRGATECRHCGVRERGWLIGR